MDELLKILAAGGDVFTIGIAYMLLQHDRSIIQIKAYLRIK